MGESGPETAGAARAVRRPRRRARHYKIQEVIRRRQVVLVQVVKEERGNKGAALTTYLSLAGRYTVLMPNTARGGGISRKITNVQDRKRLKTIAEELEVPDGMGLIIRTAGAARTKQEIRRDFEYLLRLWENVRDLTLESNAPSLVYEEGNLIKRSIRDLYSKEVDEIVVAGEPAHKEARGFMRMLMPSHAKNVVKYEEPQSLFAKYRIEQQLNAMFSPYVQLRSGGYLIINQTEALVAVDVNSGKSTREFSIEETALNTNLEAAEELSRQLKLRDLAGLIVVDFIDMEEKRNNRSVERRLKECLRTDRARIQVGRISHFGLLEMSRQRLRTGVLEGSTTPCPHCQGSGIVRSTESIALAVLRGIEDRLLTSRHPHSCVATTSSEVALYLLNHKRAFVQELEAANGVTILINASEQQQGANFVVEPLAPDNGTARQSRNSNGIDNNAGRFRTAANDDESEAESANKRPRRRRRRRGSRENGAENEDGFNRDDSFDQEARNGHRHEDDDFGDTSVKGDDGRDVARSARASQGAEGDDEERPGRRPRRRGRRGGRRNREQRAAAENTAGPVDNVAAPGAEQPAIESPFVGNDTAADSPVSAGEETASEAKPARRSRKTDAHTPDIGAPASDAGAVDAPSRDVVSVEPEIAVRNEQTPTKIVDKLETLSPPHESTPEMEP